MPLPPRLLLRVFAGLKRSRAWPSLVEVSPFSVTVTRSRSIDLSVVS